MCFAPTGKYIASCSDDGTVRVWDATTGEPVGSPLGVDAGPDGVQSVSFSPKGDVIAAGCSNGKIYLVDALAGEVKSTLAGHTRYVPAFPCSACPQSRVVCSLFSNAQGGLGRLLRQDWEEACLMQCRQDNQDLGPDNRRAHWLAPGRAQRVRTCFPMLCLFSKSWCLLTVQRYTGRSIASDLTRRARSSSHVATTGP